MKIRLEGTAEEIKDILKWIINNSNVVKYKKPYEENEVKWLKHTGTMKSRVIVMYLEVEADKYDPIDAMDEDIKRIIGECEHCNKDDRYIQEGYDSFGVHVVSVCFYGCNNPKSIVNPFEAMAEIEEDEYDPMDVMEEAYNNRPCFMDELENDDLEIVVKAQKKEIERLNGIIRGYKSYEMLSKLSMKMDIRKL